MAARVQRVDFRFWVGVRSTLIVQWVFLSSLSKLSFQTRSVVSLYLHPCVVFSDNISVFNHIFLWHFVPLNVWPTHQGKDHGFGEGWSEMVVKSSHEDLVGRMRFKSEEKESNTGIEYPRKWSNSSVGINVEEEIPCEEMPCWMLWEKFALTRWYPEDSGKWRLK